PRCPPGRPRQRRRSGRVRLRWPGRLHADFVSALQALALRPHRLGLLLFHAHEAALGTGHHDRPVPHREVTVGVASAPEEVASFAGAAFGDVALAALGALDAERHGPRVGALGLARSRQELPEAARLYNHRRAYL